MGKCLGLTGPYAHIFKEMLEESRKEVQFITPQELAGWIDSGKNFTIIDVREPDEVKAGKISAPKELEIPRGMLDVMTARGVLLPDEVYVLVCLTDGRATLEGAKLKKLFGFEKIYILKGGIRGWLKAGYPVTNKLGLLELGKKE
jgi:rhodanese-related sulfurtransferase